MASSSRDHVYREEIFDVGCLREPAAESISICLRIDTAVHPEPCLEDSNSRICSRLIIL